MSDLLRYVGGELRRRPYLIGFVLLLAGLAVWTAVPLPKRAVKRVIQRCERAIEAQDAPTMRAVLSPDFTSPHTGDLDATLGWLRQAFDMVNDVQLRIKEMEIEVAGDKATALIHFHVSVTIGGTETMSQITIRSLTDPTSMASVLEKCEMTFVRDSDGVWRIASAKLLGGNIPKLSDAP